MNLSTPAARPLENLLRSRLMAALTAPHGVDRYLDWLAPMKVAGEMRSTVLARRNETADCATLTLARPLGWTGHRAGQHITLSVEIDGVRRTRCFSIASAASANARQLEITVKAQADGFVSRHLVEQLQPGQQVVLSAPSGEFVLPEKLPEGVVLISGGSGITPVMSMLRSLLHDAFDGQIRFLHYSRSYGDLIFADELAELEARHDNLRVIRAVTGDTPCPGDVSGRFDTSHLDGFGPRENDWPAFACGPQGLIESVQGVWRQSDASDRLKYEFFQPPAVPVNRTAGSGEVRFVRSEKLIQDDGRSLLEQAEAAGLKPEHGCRMGICRSCTCRKTTGQVRNLLTGQLSGDGEEDIQPCVTTPVGDVSISL